jgi:hypothetical protein
VDQVGAGAIQSWLQNGTEKVSIRNNGALRINSPQSVADPVKLAVNVDANNNASGTACIQNVGAGDIGLRIAMEASTAGTIPALQVTKFASIVNTMAVIRASGEVRTSPGYPTNLSDNPAITVGTAVTLGGQYLQNITTVGNVGSGEDDLHSYTVAANVLANDGDSIDVSACGVILAVGTTKQLKMFFGGTAVFTSGFFDPAADFHWSIRATITRIDSDSIIANIMVMTSDGVIGGNAALACRATQVNSLTFTGTLTLKFTGQDTDGVSDRVTQTMSVVRKFARAQ